MTAIFSKNNQEVMTIKDIKLDCLATILEILARYENKKVLLIIKENVPDISVMALEDRITKDEINSGQEYESSGGYNVMWIKSGEFAQTLSTDNDWLITIDFTEIKDKMCSITYRWGSEPHRGASLENVILAFDFFDCHTHKRRIVPIDECYFRIKIFKEDLEKLTKMIDELEISNKVLEKVFKINTLKQIQEFRKNKIKNEYSEG